MSGHSTSLLEFKLSRLTALHKSLPPVSNLTLPGEGFFPPSSRLQLKLGIQLGPSHSMASWSSLVSTGLHWSPLVFTGLHWSSLVSTGLHWSPLVFTGLRGRQFASTSRGGKARLRQTMSIARRSEESIH